MASMAVRRLVGRNLISGNGNGLVMRPLVTRSFNTNAQMARLDDHDDHSDRPTVSRRRRDFPPSAFFSDVFDPFSTTRSVSQLVNLMDQLMESSAPRGVGIGGGAAIRRGWDVREDEDALRLNVDMPGLGKEDVKVSVEDNTLVIKGEAAATDGDGDGDGNGDGEVDDNRRRYSSRIDLTPNTYKIDGIKAEMKNGVLKLTVPKLQEDNKDVFQVAVD